MSKARYHTCSLNKLYLSKVKKALSRFVAITFLSRSFVHLAGKHFRSLGDRHQGQFVTLG